MEVFSKFFSIILGFILIFWVPFYLTGIRFDMLEDIRMVSEADLFLDRIRYQGYIEREEMNHFMEKMIHRRGGRRVRLNHRRRAVKPIFENGEIKETKSFFVEISFDEIKERLVLEGRYSLFVGDELSLLIEAEVSAYPFLGGKDIILGGMVENEPTEG